MMNRALNSRQKGRLLTAVFTVAALLLYLMTLHPGFASGESARRVAVAIGKVPYSAKSEVVKTRMPRLPAQLQVEAGQTPLREIVWTNSTHHRLWGIVSRAQARLPVRHLAWRMNALAAFFGALGVGLLFSLMRTLVLLFSFHVSAVPALLRKRVANMAGAASAATLAVAVPYWLSATRCLPHTFDLFMFLLMGWLILKALLTHREWPLFGYALLQGMMIFESDAGFLMLPLLVFFAIRAIRMGDIGYSGGGVALVTGAAFGIFAYLLLAWLGNLVSNAPASFALPISDLGNSVKYLWKMLFGGWRSDALWMVVLIFAVAPALIVVSMTIWGGAGNPGSSNVVLIMVLLGAMTMALTGSSLSLWGAHRLLNTPAYPCTAFLLAALVVGFVAAQACMMTGGRLVPDVSRSVTRSRPGSVTEPGATNPPLGRMIISYLVVLLLAVGIFNLREVLDWRDPLSCSTARESVRRLRDIRWLISDGSLDMLTRLYAHQAKKPLSFISDSDTFMELSAAAIEQLQRDTTFEGLDVAQLALTVGGSNGVTVAQGLLNLTPEANLRLRIAQRPELWERAGYQAVPDITGYRGSSATEKIDWLALQQEHYNFWDRIELLPALGNYAPAWLRGERAAIRQRLYTIGSRLADCLAQAGHTAEARDTAMRARRIREEPLPAESDAFY